MPGTQSIAFVSPRFTEGGAVGGAETLLRNLATRAARAGHRVTFLTTCARDHFTWQNERPAGSETHDGMQVLFFPVDNDRDVDSFLRVQESISRGRTVAREEQTFWLQNSVNSRELYDHLRQNGENYDLVIVGPYLFGLSYAAALIHPDKTILVPCLHDEPFAYLDVFHELFSAVCSVMFNSEPEQELGCRLYGLERGRTTVVGMGLDPFDSNAERFRQRSGVADTFVMYSGRREALKGTPLLLDYLEAFRARTGRDIKLVLTGSGVVDISPQMRPYVADLGFVSEQEKHDAMAAALVFCHPSVNESLGIVLLEAWLAGTCALVHGCGAVLRHQCRKSNGGLWFGNYPEFEQSLVRLLDEPELRDRLAGRGREYVLSEYSWERIESRFFEAVEKWGR